MNILDEQEDFNLRRNLFSWRPHVSLSNKRFSTVYMKQKLCFRSGIDTLKYQPSKKFRVELSVLVTEVDAANSGDDRNPSLSDFDRGIEKGVILLWLATIIPGVKPPPSAFIFFPRPHGHWNWRHKIIVPGLWCRSVGQEGQAPTCWNISELFWKNKVSNCHPSLRLSLKQRIGIGILSSSAAMAALAIIESARRETAIKDGFSDDLDAVLPISAMWLLLYFFITRSAEAFAVLDRRVLLY
uniref:Uncharacterized protein n=1 Tax=Salix viminalis TaxID=40686 RepID=A0A6N2NLS1_SALVM